MSTAFKCNGCKSSSHYQGNSIYTLKKGNSNRLVAEDFISLFIAFAIIQINKYKQYFCFTIISAAMVGAIIYGIRLRNQRDVEKVQQLLVEATKKTKQRV